MKKFGLFLIAAIAVTAFTSCNDDDGDYPRNNPLITTVRTLDGGDYYFQRDNGETLYPGDKSRIPGYKAEDKQRAIIWFNLLSGIQGYDYNIALYAVDNIYTGTSEVVSTPERLEELGDDPTGYPTAYENYFNLSKEWLTVYALYAVTDNSKHSFSVIVNDVPEVEPTAESGESDENYLDVELRHNADGDLSGVDRGYYLSFDLSGIAERLEGKKGITLRIKTRENGTKYLKLDLPQEK